MYVMIWKVDEIKSCGINVVYILLQQMIFIVATKCYVVCIFIFSKYMCSESRSDH